MQVNFKLEQSLVQEMCEKSERHAKKTQCLRKGLHAALYDHQDDLQELLAVKASQIDLDTQVERIIELLKTPEKKFISRSCQSDEGTKDSLVFQDQLKDLKFYEKTLLEKINGLQA